MQHNEAKDNLARAFVLSLLIVVLIFLIGVDKAFPQQPAAALNATLTGWGVKVKAHRVVQQNVPAAPSVEQLYEQWRVLNDAYWAAPTLAEKDGIQAQLDVLRPRLDDMFRAQLAANTAAFEDMIPKFTLAFIVTQPPTATYRTHGPAILNDLTATPGAAGDTPQATLCSPSFHTGTVRNVPESLKQRVCRAYGIARADCTGSKVEIDHLISLELGGTNDQANLWPQPYAPRPGAKEKDVVENWLHRQVCTNAMPLAEAQHAIATDWYQVYLTVPKANGGGGQ